MQDMDPGSMMLPAKSVGWLAPWSSKLETAIMNDVKDISVKLNSRNTGTLVLILRHNQKSAPDGNVSRNGAARFMESKGC